MSMDYFRIGLFLRPHGIKGELKLLPLTDDLKRFARLSDAFIEAPEGVYQTVTAESARVAAENSVIIKLKGIDTVEAAEKLRLYQFSNQDFSNYEHAQARQSSHTNCCTLRLGTRSCE